MGRNQARSEKCFSNRIAYIGLNKNKKLKVFKFSLPLIKVCKFETSNTEVLMFRDSVFICFHDTKDIRKRLGNKVVVLTFGYGQKTFIAYRLILTIFYILQLLT